jgi:hypothetical protein
MHGEGFAAMRSVTSRYPCQRSTWARARFTRYRDDRSVPEGGLAQLAYDDSEPSEGLASLGPRFVVMPPPGSHDLELSVTVLAPDDAPHHDEQPAIEARHCAAKRGAHW